MRARSTSLIILGILISMSILPVIATAGYVPPFSVTASAPTAVSTGETFNVTFDAPYGFSNYTLTAYLSADNLSGISSSNSNTTTIHLKSVKNDTITATITAPTVPETLEIAYIETANYSSSHVRYQGSISVQIITPIVFHATLRNSGNAPIYNVNVEFILNSVEVGNKTVHEIPPKSTVSINYTYSSSTISNGKVVLNVIQGENTLNVTVTNTQVTLPDGHNYYVTKFYYGQVPNYSWIYYVAGVVVVVMVIMAMGAGKKRNLPRKPKWKK
ncbi:MAG: CARDB domain-containing protein [Thermoplasmataceae archaeon]